MVKNPPADVGDGGSVPGLGRSPEGNGYPLQYSCLGKPHEQRNLEGVEYMNLQRTGHDLTIKQQTHVLTVFQMQSIQEYSCF